MVGVTVIFFFHEALSRHIYNELQGDRPTF